MSNDPLGSKIFKWWTGHVIFYGFNKLEEHCSVRVLRILGFLLWAPLSLFFIVLGFPLLIWAVLSEI